MTSYPTVSTQNSGGVYQDNLVSIGQFLMSNGFSQAAAAGVAGTIAGEGEGSPEVSGSAGWGLLGWTPPTQGSPNPQSSAFHGNSDLSVESDYTTKVPAATLQSDFNKQLEDLIGYAQSNSAEAVSRGGVDLQSLEKATDPNQAATWWSEFEGPANPGSDVRSADVSLVYSALNGYKPNSGYQLPANLPSGGGSSPSGGGGGGTTCLGFKIFGQCIGTEVPSLQSLEQDALGYLERFGLFLLGGILIVMGIIILFKDSNGGKQATGAAQNYAGGKAAGLAKGGGAAADAADVAMVAA